MVFINQISKHIRFEITRRHNKAEIDMVTRTRDSKPMAAVYTVSRGNARARVCALVTAYGMLMARAPYDQGYRPFLLPTRSHAVYFAPVSFTTTNVTHEYTPDDPGPLHYVTKLT